MRVPSKKKDMEGYQDRDLATAAMSSDDEEVVDSEVEREQEDFLDVAMGVGKKKIESSKSADKPMNAYFAFKAKESKVYISLSRSQAPKLNLI